MNFLNERGFVFVGRDSNAYRCCMWGNHPWLFRWRDGENCWESIQPLTQMEIWMLPHNLTEEQQEWYFTVEAKNIHDIPPNLPDN